MSELASPLKEAVFPVKGMSCAGCANSVENILKRQEGVHTAGVNFADHSAHVIYDPTITPVDLQAAVQAVGFDLIVPEAQEDMAELQADYEAERYHTIRKQTIWAAVFTLPVFVLGMFFMIGRPATGCR